MNIRPQICIYWHVDNDQNETIFSTFNRKILGLTIPIVCKKNLSQNDHTNCKIITIVGEDKVFLVGCLDFCQCFEIQ
jgi:hypothetical protein